MAKESELTFQSIQKDTAKLQLLSKNCMLSKGASIHKINELNLPEIDMEKDFLQQLELQRQQFEEK